MTEMYRVLLAGRKPFVTNDPDLAERVSKMYNGARVQKLNSQGKWVAYG